MTNQEKELVAAYRQLSDQAQKVLLAFTINSAKLELRGKDIPAFDSIQAPASNIA